MKFFLLIQFLLIFCFFASAQSQMLYGNDVFEKLPDRYVMQIKQLDHFIERFNNRKNEPGFRFDAPDQKSLNRDEAIASLFNHGLLHRGTFKEDAIAFIKEVTGQSLHLSFYDNEYFATVDCKVLYKERLKDLKLTLSLEGDAKDGSRWIIIGAEADFLDLQQSETNKIIPPSNHEVDFTELINLFNEQKNEVINYTREDYKPHQLDILFYIIKNNEIKLLSTSLPTYHFLQVNGWIFTVDFFNRDSNNSGWLISSLKKAESSDTSDYKKNKLHITH